MSDRRRRSHDEYTREPIFIERSPQLYNLFRTRKKKVHIIEEVPVRSRRPERRSWSPPPRPPPSPPRGPYHTMSSNTDDNIFTPLPPKLPPKTKHHHEDDPIEYVVEARSPRHPKVKIIHESVDDDDAHPKVESPSPPRKRDSGKYYMTGARMDEDHDGARREYERVRPDPEVQRLRDDLEREERKRRQAELTAAAAKEKADRLKLDLDYEKRQRSLEKRERDLAERETRLNQEEREHLVETRRPRERQGVVVHNPPAVVSVREPNRSALDRARDDYDHLRSQQARDDRRPGTGDSRRPRRQSIIIVDDEHDRDRDRRQRR